MSYHSKYSGAEVDALLDKIKADDVGSIDSSLSTTSENPVKNKVITEELNKKANKTDIATINGQPLTNGGNIEVVTEAYDDTEIKGEVRHIERDLGMYPELEPVPLNAEVTGKYINSDGKYVDASDWNVASIGTVSLGNTYLLNMVSSANMVLGVALFVSRVYKRDKEGKIIGTTLTPLFSAKNTSIPASGYVLFEAMDDYDDVLVCYKPTLATQMLVARWGFKASHATQLRNLRLIVDNKTDFEGIYELLTAGYALNLVGKGNGEPQAFLSRKTGGGNITDGSAVIKEVDGVQPIVWNQLMNKIFSYNSGTSVNVTNETGVVTIVVPEGGIIEQTLVFGGPKTDTIIGHKYLVRGGLSPQAYFAFGTASSYGEGEIYTESTAGRYGYIYLRVGTPAGTYKLRPLVHDLTQMFGAGNEPSTYEEYLDRISHYHIEDTYAYNAGEIVNYRGTGIKTTGRNIWDEEWEVGSLDGSNGKPSLNGKIFRSKNYCPIFGNTEYYLASASFPINIFFYDKDKNFMDGKTVFGQNKTFITPENAAFFKVRTDSPNNTYNHDICINLSDPAFNGQYEPYKSYVRDWSEVMKKYFPDGMTSLNGVKDFFNDKKAVRKYGVVDLGELSWKKDAHWGADATYFSAILPGGKVLSNSNAICAKYEQKTRSPENARTTCSMYDGDGVSRGYINIADKAYDNSSANDFKTAVKGVRLYYELAEPVEDIFEKPLNLTYTVINGGTETSLATENSTQFEGSIAYNKDYVAVVDELQMQNRVTIIEFENWEN